MKNARFSNGVELKLIVFTVGCVLLLGAFTAFAGESNLVRKVQESLVEKGFDPGKVDGLWGPRTKGAVKMFQESVGLAGSGELTDQTKEKLFAGGATAASQVTSASSGSPNPGGKGCFNVFDNKTYSSGEILCEGRGKVECGKDGKWVSAGMGC